MKKIVKLIEALTAAERELTDLAKLKRKASDDLLLVANPGITVETARTKILDARLTIDLVDAKLAKQEPLRKKTAGELLQLVRTCADKWNEQVNNVRLELEADLIEITRPFFEHDVRACRRWWEQGNFIQMPIFHNHRDGEYRDQALKVTQFNDEIKIAKHFLAWVDRHRGAVGIKKETIDGFC